jgi:pyruvate dehydrogenase E1 component alpha subunit
LLECVTYRNYGHFEGDEQKYKNDAGKEKKIADVDCITAFKDYALKQKVLTEKEVNEIAKASTEDIQAAITFAQESSVPRPEALFEDVYA